MKPIAIFLLPFLVMTCGIVEFLFPISYPQRYIERDVNPTELVGTWKLTSDSETRIITYFKQKDVPWGLSAPWKSMTLHNDGSCKVDFELSWSLNNDVLKEPDALPTCTWKIFTILGYEEGGSFKDVPGLLVRFEHYNKEADMYNVVEPELYIVEENNELVLWNTIGDSPFNFQDFKRINK